MRITLIIVSILLMPGTINCKESKDFSGIYKKDSENPTMYETIIIKNNNGTYELDIFPESYEDRPSKKEKITYTFKDNTFTGFTYWPMKWEFIIIVYPDKNELLFTYPDDNSPKWHKYKYHKLNTQP